MSTEKNCPLDLASVLQPNKRLEEVLPCLFLCGASQTFQHSGQLLGQFRQAANGHSKLATIHNAHAATCHSIYPIDGPSADFYYNNYKWVKAVLEMNIIVFR